MTDSTTMIIQRRIRHWKTTAAGIASIVCPLVALFVTPELAVKILSISAVLSGAGLIAAADATKTGVGKLPLALLASVLAVIGSGCSSFRSTQTETSPDGTVRETVIRARTFFDARSDLAKLRASTTDKTQGVTIGSLGQESSGSNATALVHGIVGAAVEAGIRAAVKP